MNTDHFLDYLVEADVGEPNVQHYFDRLMMRLFESPALLASFVRATTFQKEKDVVIQLEFQRVPREYHTTLTKIAGVREAQVVDYEQDSGVFTGLHITLTTDDITPKSQKSEPIEYPFQGQPQPASAGSSAASFGFR